MAMTLNPSRLRLTTAKYFGNWQVAGSGVTALTEGTGITLTPNPIVGTGTIDLVTPVANVNGGTGADTSATGGAGQYVKQAGVGAAFTVGTIPATDIGAGFVKVDGTTPLTADWDAGAQKITTAEIATNVAAPDAKAEFHYAATDALPITALHPAPRTFAVADGSNGTPVTAVNPTEFHARIDAADMSAENLGAFQFVSKKVGGKGGIQGIQSWVDGVGGDPTLDEGHIGVVSYVVVDPGAPPTGVWNNYAYWGVASRYQTHSRAIGMELDVLNHSGTDAFWSATVAANPDADHNSTIGLAINCGGANKNSVALTFEGSGTGNDVWKTGIFFPNSGIGVYAIDAGSLPSTKFPLRIAHGSTVVARNAADSADYSILRANGTTNVAVGNLSLLGAVADSAANTACGSQALMSAVAGGNNTAVGANALMSDVGGGQNTAVGRDALTLNVSGSQNTAVGMNTLSHITANNDNTAVGYNALHATTNVQNTAVGSGALAANTSGAVNTAVGYGALAAASTANYNTAVGTTALYKATGSSNIAVGFASLYENLAGTDNVAVGIYASKLNTAGSRNVSIGDSALFTNSTGNGNIALGFNAGQYETGSDAFYVDNQDRTNTAGDKANAILYGQMAAAAANQKLTINALVHIGVSLPAYANNAAAVGGGLVAGDLYVVSGSDPRQVAIVF